MSWRGAGLAQRKKNLLDFQNDRPNNKGTLFLNIRF